MPSVTITRPDGESISDRPVEYVERKGVGHPDSLCDGIAEAVSRRLCRRYREATGDILHHNTDKVQLVAGETAPTFGGGEIRQPIAVMIAGRAAPGTPDHRLPVADIAKEAARDYVADTAASLPDDGITFEARIGETSPGLRSLFAGDGVPLANDTSIGVGYAPMSETEQIVRTLTPRIHREIDAVGEDVKVMACRQDDEMHLTIAAAVISQPIDSLPAYRSVVDNVSDLARKHARGRTDRTVTVTVNGADDRSRDAGSDDVYLTVTGLSAEMGDDGNVGRGNRANGLITPHRPMSLEAVAGKNPVSHVGKLYNLLAFEAAGQIHEELGCAATVRLLSEIGQPVDDPFSVEVESTARDVTAIRGIVREHLEGIPDLTERIVRGEVAAF